MLSLFSEIIVSILGASLLGLFAGWMIQKSLGKRKLAGTIATWEERLNEAEDNARRDSEHLEDQLQSLGDEVKALTDTNRSLKEALKDNESIVHQARTDAMELNRQQAETQERLQRIIQEKELKISELAQQMRDGNHGGATAVSGAAAATATGSVIDNEFATEFATDDEQTNIDDTAVAEFEDGLTVRIEDQTEAFDNKISQLLESEADQTETVAFPSTITDTLDDTARLGTTSSHPVVGTLPDDPYDATLDATADMADNSLVMEEATVALDDEALRFARTPPRRRD